ncbi:16S rRNA (cytosine(1402)-N(4))-methyltransferase RsmH [Pantoea sp. Aalb]|uniref:16S rRNA (cytosine(1402)-N(4))-methyltransferase RsmH n=1 Tax=Pantoea sp. Aalb TaxID=2576762 RepID=UPI00132A05B1|nr:16S rRNA (cytosine(1402)-N(4))-methyltransferase RsmH [Pantoea sp. Aalb]MXP67178.1 16S rRNA (cytosine(1402)-N(4))-methyltransferase RsmH [Pantoea sp. Aalb]
MYKKYTHNTVMLEQAVNSLNIKKNGIYIDCTFGVGGHSQLILSKLGKTGKLLAIDRDPQAIAIASKIKDPRFSIIHGSFSSLLEYVTKRGLIGKIDGILLDLGVSSPQLNDPERGFSFMYDGPLDMRMDQTRGQSAAEWLLKAKKADITFVLKKYGEERFAKRIACAIVEQNFKKPIMTTKELVKIITAAIPIKDKFKHPATRSFLAIRIWINKELEEINRLLKDVIPILALNGRLSIISFHSLEDRLVKRFIRNQSRGPQVPIGVPISEMQLKEIGGYKLINIGKLIPEKIEIKKNPCARSSILRIAEKKY